MNSIGFVISAIVIATVVTLCGIKLFDMNSEFSEPIYKFGPFIGIAFALFAVFGLLLPDISEVTDNIAPIIFASIASFAIVCFGLSLLRRRLLSIHPDNKRAKKQLPRGSFVGICAIDAVEGVFAGFATGMSFAFNSGAGIVTLCAMIMLQISTKVAMIREYQDSGASRNQNMTALLVSLFINTATAIVVYLLTHGQIQLAGILATISVGFIIYRVLAHLWLIVKKYQNR